MFPSQSQNDTSVALLARQQCLILFGVSLITFVWRVSSAVLSPFGNVSGKLCLKWLVVSRRPWRKCALPPKMAMPYPSISYLNFLVISKLPHPYERQGFEHMDHVAQIIVDYLTGQRMDMMRPS